MQDYIGRNGRIPPEFGTAPLGIASAARDVVEESDGDVTVVSTTTRGATSSTAGAAASSSYMAADTGPTPPFPPEPLAAPLPPGS